MTPKRQQEPSGLIIILYFLIDRTVVYISLTHQTLHLISGILFYVNYTSIKVIKYLSENTNTNISQMSLKAELSDSISWI